MNKDVLIIGAGPAGLAAAVTLLRGGVEPIVLESSSRAGGSIVTHRENGFLVEGGPNSLMLEKDGVEDFFHQLGLVPLEASSEAKKRFLVCAGRPVAAPAGLFGAIGTPLLSLRGKLRVLGEPFARRAPEGDETVGAFVRRRLGAEAALRLVDPLVSGIYAGDIEKLSLRSAFPRLHLMEEKYGSLVLAGLRKRRAAPVRRMVNFAGGMAEIPNSMVRVLGEDRIRLGAAVQSIEKNAEGWRVTWLNDGEKHVALARCVLLACTPQNWEKLPLPASLSALLRPWHLLAAPPLSVISLGYAREQVAHPIDGFGMLAPGVERRKILGTLFQSSCFKGRAPDGHVLLTTFLGGSRNATLTSEDEASQIKIVRDELNDLLGVRGSPVFTHITRWNRAIPQYNTGHESLLALLASASKTYPNLFFTGNYCAGVALPKTILHAITTARDILEKLK
ncbi:MAG: protoporphyrinogen oxidase [Puniceicoccales bacterium]|jgi:oxygen-dependent protoporphyrinogen oxidase|nr:protoporphyrinogen oxidase [Puniceicoccales bacterium]